MPTRCRGSGTGCWGRVRRRLKCCTAPPFHHAGDRRVHPRRASGRATPSWRLRAFRVGDECPGLASCVLRGPRKKRGHLRMRRFVFSTSSAMACAIHGANPRPHPEVLAVFAASLEGRTTRLPISNPLGTRPFARARNYGEPANHHRHIPLIRAPMSMRGASSMGRGRGAPAGNQVTSAKSESSRSGMKRVRAA